MTTGSPRSAGILLYRVAAEIQVLIGHPGGPFWANKHEGAWSIIKGLAEPGEDLRAAALREFEEETGMRLAPENMIDLGEIVQRSGKIVRAWAVAGDFNVSQLRSNPVRLEWPRGSGRQIEFPEIDQVRWCAIGEATELLNPAQLPLLKRLQESLDHTR